MPQVRALLCLALVSGCALDERNGVEPREVGRGAFEVMGQVLELDYTVENGRYVVFDDVVLDPEQRVVSGGQPLFKYGSSATSYLWPNGTVPYVIDANVTNPAAIKAAMAEWTNKTGIRFIPRTTQAGYVKFWEEPGNGVCRAQLGYDGSVQYVYLRDTRSGELACPTNIVVHELGHTLGFWHEQQRSERDTYVRINSSCIPTGSNAYTILTSGVLKVGGYDIDSTMHYRSTTYNRSGCGGYAIYKKDGSLILHDWATLSAGDIAGTAQIYGAVVDTDGDGIKDVNDNCRTVSNASQLDTDKDLEGNACDPDDDNDGDLDAADNCPLLANGDQVDANSDGIGDACQSDGDADGAIDEEDNCPADANADQADADGDGIGDVCEDTDSDGVVDLRDSCPAHANADQLDSDGDGLGDACDAPAVIAPFDEAPSDAGTGAESGQVREDRPSGCAAAPGPLVLLAAAAVLLASRRRRRA